MNPNEVIEYWMESAGDDLVVAEHLLQSGDYLWCLFVAHLVVEKALKAAVVSSTGSHAPPIHNLIRLARLAGLEADLDESTEGFFAELTRFNIETRYPKDRQALRAVATREYVVRQLAQVRRTMEWIENRRS